MALKNEPWTKVHESACADARLSDRDLRVFIAVKIRAGESSSCWEIVERIAERAGGMSSKSVRRGIENLKAHGYLTETPDSTKKSGRLLTPVRPVLPAWSPVSTTLDNGDHSAGQPCPGPWSPVSTPSGR